MVKGRTDQCFEDFMATLPEAVLDGGGTFEDEGRQGARHEWRFEFGGGMEALAWNIVYHQGSASLPDEFADMVVQAERLTHAWYQAGVAEETGQEIPVPSVPAPPAPKPGRTPSPASNARKAPAAGRAATPTLARSRAGQPVPASRERIALAVLLDLLALSVPWAFLSWLVVGGQERVGPPGAGLVLFAILEFVLLQIARRSLGYWLLGISAELGHKPMVDPRWPVRESRGTLAFGIGLCALGVGGLTSWTAYHTPVPYFGLGFPIWLSVPLTLLGSVALMLAGGLVLRLDVRGLWLGAGLAAVLLLSGLAGWGDWGGFVEAAFAERSVYVGRPVGDGLLGGLARTLVPLLMVAVPAALAVGAWETWRRFEGRVAGAVTVAPKPS
jgi:hypothetical protein